MEPQHSDSKLEHDRHLQELQQRMKDASLSVDDLLPESEWLRYSEAHPDGQVFQVHPVYHSTIRKKKRIEISLLVLFGILTAGLSGYLLKGKAVATTEIAWIENQNNTSQMQACWLPDSSKVLLFPEASIRYQEDFAQKHRALYLEGSGQFEVEGQADLPFEVYHAELKTTVLGTRFEIKQTDSLVYVNLYEGKVQVQHQQVDNLQTILVPGQYMSYASGQTIFQSGSLLTSTKTKAAPAAIKPQVLTDGQSGKTYLEFHNESLSEVLDYLAHKHSIEIQYPTDIALYSNVMISIETDLPVEIILRNICRIHNLKLQILHENTFVISN
jgi:ferric-dicitrate binding protein FerR (iron transport regulator)